jgi:hypothetical protein
MQNVLKDVPDNRLRAYIVWLPMFPNDSRDWAQTRSDEFKDDRLTYYWDKDRLSGQEWRKVLNIDRNAWDIYFLYEPTSQWDKEIPQPAFWMHQLGGLTKGPKLNKDEFEAKVKELLAAAK